MKVVLVYDRVNKLGGAERVLEALHHLYPEAPLYTSVYHPDTAVWADDFEVRASFVNRIPAAKKRHEYLAPLMPYAFESFDLSGFDVVISVTSAEAKGVITHPGQLHVCYMLTPTRYLWSKASEYSGRSWKKAMRLPWMSSLRRWDWVAAHRPDVVVPISETVAERVRNYYQLEPESVIYPPVETAYFREKDKGILDADGEYFLMVSRLVKYKRVDQVIEIFNQMPDQRLVIVGEGAEQKRLGRLAGENVSLKGNINQEELRSYYQHATALVFPQEEDFGIVAVEAMAAGIPVIGLNRGGVAEIVQDGVSGILLDEVKYATLNKAVGYVQKKAWSKAAIQQRAQKFDRLEFESQFNQLIEALWLKHRK